LNSHGLRAAESAAALMSAFGLFVTLALLPETKNKSSEEITGINEKGEVTGN
jgi:hypothetical protein